MNKRSVRLLLAIFASIALFVAACGARAPAGPTEVHVTLSEFKIELDQTSIPTGPIKFIIENVGSEEHELVLELAGVNDEPLAVNDQESEVEDIHPGDATTFEWTLDNPGQYQLACHIPGHYEAGMVTTFTVTAP